MRRVVGVDGCREGWVVVVREPGGPPSVRIEGDLRFVVHEEEAAVVAIDIPIGLLDAAVPGGRECERLARNYLSPRGSSVFSSPVRACFGASGHAEASERSRRSSPHGPGISRQCWGIADKIAEVDRLRTPDLQARIVEVHPEVSFAAMNGGRPLGHGKKKREGREERAALLARHWGCAVLDLSLERRSGAKPDEFWTRWRQRGRQSVFATGRRNPSRKPQCSTPAGCAYGSRGRRTSSHNASYHRAAMDPIDNFYQALDSEQVLKRHGPELLAEARGVLAEDPDARVAGLITLPDSNEAHALRAAIGAGGGHDVPAGGLMIGLVPREAVEGLLASRCGAIGWREEAWQQQQVLPVVVSTKDGFRFGFFGLGAAPSP